MANKWDQIWKNRSTDIKETQTVFETFCELKRMDGFDTQDIEGYYEAFYEQWKDMADRIAAYCGDIESVYEVGCGSGVNLYLFRELKAVKRMGGIDYSPPLIEAAKELLKDAEMLCTEAIDLPRHPRYDVVLADSVFQYFEDTDYGMKVLEGMWEKADKMVVITEIHDLEKMEEHMAYRRRCVADYDKKYEGLNKTFYDKNMFREFAERVNAKCVITEPKNDIYWNNRFVFDCYLYK